MQHSTNATYRWVMIGNGSLNFTVSRGWLSIQSRLDQENYCCKSITALKDHELLMSNRQRYSNLIEWEPQRRTTTVVAHVFTTNDKTMNTCHMRYILVWLWAVSTVGKGMFDNHTVGPRLQGTILGKQLRIEGFIVLRFSDRNDEANTTLAQWVQEVRQYI